MNTISSWIRGVTCKVYTDSVEDRDIQARLLAQHTAIVDAIRRGDGPAAREAMAEHLRFAEETAHRTGDAPECSETATP